MKMDLREILAGGGSVTEIRASEVLIIKPSPSPEERNLGGGGGKDSSREDGERKSSMDGRFESLGRELRMDMSWLREKEKERPWGQATVIKEDRKNSLDGNVAVDRGGRVSQLLSKFGEHPKPPSRSKSSDNFHRPGRRKYSGDEDDQQSEADRRNTPLKGVPKRSFSFSDRVIGAKENGLDGDRYQERKRMHSEKSVGPWVDIADLGKETVAGSKLGCARLLDKDRFGKHREKHLKNEDEKEAPMQRRNEADVSIQHRSEVKKVNAVDARAVEKAGDADGDEGFTVASVKNTEGISFARRVPIRHDGKARAEREMKRLPGEKRSERVLSAEKHSEVGGQVEVQVYDKKVSDFQREEGFQSTMTPEATQKSYIIAASAEPACLCHAAESQYRHESAFTECSNLHCPVTDRARDPHGGPEWSGTGPQGLYVAHSVLSQHTEDFISKIEKIGDTTVYSKDKVERTYKVTYEVSKESKQDMNMYSDAGSENLVYDDITPRSPERIASMGIHPGPLEIQIPRTVFYVAEEMVERKKAVGQSDEWQDWEGGKGVERRDSWRIGKPLSRIESLREKIRQRELERLKQRDAQDGGGSDSAETNVTQTAEDRRDERGTEMQKEWEAAAYMRKRLVEAERGQEDAEVQTSMTAFDVTQEVSVLKTCPQLPVSVPHSQAVREEVSSEYATDASEVISDSSQISEDEDDPVKHVEEQLRRHRGQHENREEREEEEEEEEEEKELSEEEQEEYTSPNESVQSLSPLPPHPNSPAAMSRIYNLETVGSRSGLCMRERTVDIPSVHLVKVKPIIKSSNAQQADTKGFSGEDICGVQKIQRQIEQFQLKEQEELKSRTSPNSSLKDREAKGQQSPRGLLKVKDDAKTQEKDQETPNLKVSPQGSCSPTSQLKPSNQTITITSSLLRTQSPDNTLKASDCAPTPASSPSSLSPAQSPSVSPSPTPSPTLFSIRSASGGKVKRGATITITPKKPAGGSGGAGGGGGGGGGGGVVTGSNTAAVQTPAKTSSLQAQTTSAVAEPVKKKYPTVEEIEVIGGYQNLEKSCLIKNRGTPKRGKVCFDEDQLEQVCEYPSETTMLAYTPSPHDLWKLQGEEAKAEEAVTEGGTIQIQPKSTKNVGIGMGRGLRVGQCHPLLKKHNV
ncbi:Taperin [Larimichthys crocea]|uniref:Uncharacterized protein n=1 Tax=Larimichthys crocea TaxID=215358 RepID=A0ACD3RFM6_LARCR|nr:Taperin [Larimichthys crocea]